MSVFSNLKPVDMSSMFKTAGIRELDLSYMNLENLESMRSICYMCENLETVKFGKQIFKASTLNLNFAFAYSTVKQIDTSNCVISSKCSITELAPICEGCDYISSEQVMKSFFSSQIETN